MENNFSKLLGEKLLREYNYLLSQSVTEGKTFTVGVKNSEYYDLMSLGFKKVPTK